MLSMRTTLPAQGLRRVSSQPQLVACSPSSPIVGHQQGTPLQRSLRHAEAAPQQHMQSSSGLPRVQSSLFDLEDLLHDHTARTTLAVARDASSAAALGEAAGACTRRVKRSGLGAVGLFDRTSSGLLPEEIAPSQLSALLSGPMPRMLDACKPANAFEQQIAVVVRQLLGTSSGQVPGSPGSAPSSPSSPCATHVSTAVIQTVATGLLSLGYMVQVRDATQEQQQTAQGAGADGRPRGSSHAPHKEPFAQLHHRFLTCTGVQSAASADPIYLPEPVIIELRFREQFVIQFNGSAPQYESMLTAVPPLFVGTLPRLEAAVDVLASEITRVFRQQGRPLPPWRTRKSMLSKWVPDQLRGLAKLLAQGSAAYGPPASPGGKCERVSGGSAQQAQGQQQAWAAAAAAAAAACASGGFSVAATRTSFFGGPASAASFGSANGSICSVGSAQDTAEARAGAGEAEGESVAALAARFLSAANAGGSGADLSARENVGDLPPLSPVLCGFTSEPGPAGHRQEAAVGQVQAPAGTLAQNADVGGHVTPAVAPAMAPTTTVNLGDHGGASIAPSVLAFFHRSPPVAPDAPNSVSDGQLFQRILSGDLRRIASKNKRVSGGLASALRQHGATNDTAAETSTLAPGTAAGAETGALAPDPALGASGWRQLSTAITAAAAAGGAAVTGAGRGLSMLQRTGSTPQAPPAVLPSAKRADANQASGKRADANQAAMGTFNATRYSAAAAGLGQRSQQPRGQASGGVGGAGAGAGAAHFGNGLRAVIQTVLNEPWARIHKVKLGPA